MIRNVAIEMLNLIKNNDGLDRHEIYTKPSIELQKIIDIILSETRCSIVDSNGNYVRFGSSTDIRVIKNLIKIFLSNSKEIPPEIVSMALTKEETLGPFIKINFQKKYDEQNKLYEIEMDNVFPDDFYTNIFEKNLEIRNEFIDEIVKPYVKELIFENDILMNKSPIGAYISKKISKIKEKNELVDDLVKILKKILKCDDNLIENIANYIVINIMNNKYFKAELIHNALDTTELQELGKVYTGFNSLVESMISETIRMIDLKSFPYGEYISIKNTYYTEIAVLMALSTNLENANEDEILSKMQDVNRFFAITDGGKKDINFRYRSKKLHTDKYGDIVEFVDCNSIPIAMNNLCKMIKVLLEKKDDIGIEAYTKEVIRIHYRFLRIRPFEKANGRTVRAIVNMLLQSKEMVRYI